MLQSMIKLNFDNKALRVLPLDTNLENYVRRVPNACFSRVYPTPVKNPKIVSLSTDCLALLDLPQECLNWPVLADYLSGNAILPGSEPAAHCYCGHQFGHFAGQLGDGATMYLGEIVNSKHERWEIQFKGAGKTPYSRSADGRKVLRSSIREYLCSEAMHYLGVETTRAASCVTSDTRVERDIFYDGNVIQERATIIMRVAPTFIRFGSFEITKTLDPITARCGPSVGNKEIIPTLVNYVIETFYPEIYSAYSDDKTSMLTKFFQEVVQKTARLVAKWQCVGFCHGVLNTDNMSIIGLTIDYGPFGFMDTFDPDFICNASDNGGRYTYAKQPTICRWNCFKLAEALAGLVDLNILKKIVEDCYWSTYNQAYLNGMRAKLGLLNSLDEDAELVESLFSTMHQSGADFTQTFVALGLINNSTQPALQKQAILQALLLACCSVKTFKEMRKPKMSAFERQLFALLRAEGNFEDMSLLGQNEEDQETQNITESSKKQKDEELWSSWIDKYIMRLNKDGTNDNVCQQRSNLMKSSNPRIVLRNYLAEEAIRLAEKGDYSGVNELLDRLKTPFEPDEQWAAKKTSVKHESSCSKLAWESKPPDWASELKVT